MTTVNSPFNNSKELFQKAAKIAESAGDSYAEYMAYGMMELAQAMQQKMRDLQSGLEKLK